MYLVHFARDWGTGVPMWSGKPGTLAGPQKNFIQKKFCKGQGKRTIILEKSRKTEKQEEKNKGQTKFSPYLLSKNNKIFFEVTNTKKAAMLLHFFIFLHFMNERRDHPKSGKE